MIIWIDAQLSPALANWIQREFGFASVAVRDLELRDSTDLAIFEAARAAGACVLTKDADFAALVERLGSPPTIIWLRCGNSSNANVQRLLMTALPRAAELFRAGESLVEITDPHRR